MMQSNALEAAYVSYITSALALCILALRLVLALLRRRFDARIFLVVASVVAVVARIVVNIYYLNYGNTSDVLKHGYTDETNLDDVRIGSKLVLVSRVLVTVVLWLQICILLLFYSQVTQAYTTVAPLIKITWVAVVVTFVAVVLVTFLECRPIQLYWQLYPDPGYCVYAYAQLFTQAVSNMVLDVLLLIIAFPITHRSQRIARPLTERITIYALYLLGTFCIAISIIRLVSVLNSDSLQSTRSLWAAVQMFVSTFVANAPSIYGSIRALRSKRRKPKHNHPDSDGPSSRRIRQSIDSFLKVDDDEDFNLALASLESSALSPMAAFHDEGKTPGTS
ncbi:hypothetical protein GGS20DRAFT_366668 [Poronia punctata]|nr:hypothetical protein GGS20DRAFT_366668 [Poronia punctata]